MLSALLSVFSPKYCFVCNKKGSYLCRSCLKDYLDLNLIQRCHVCSKPVRYGFLHEDCSLMTHLDGLIYLTVYNQLAKDLVKTGKYNGIYTIFNELGSLMGQYLQSFYHFDNKKTLVVPIPMHRFKQNKRGYNQAKILAKKVSFETNLQYCDLLMRIRNTKTQVGMSDVERENNLGGAFKINNKSVYKLTNLDTILLVDDVFTTGTTLKECARLLKQNGVKTVIGFTFAKTRQVD